jgi:thioredoxin reductase (NADPH)
MSDVTLDVIIIGGGPAGLAAAIAAKQHGLRYQVLEQGALVNSLLHYPTHMVFFTTPELLEIGGVPFVSPYEKPTRAEALRYYRKVTDAFDLEVAQYEPVVGLSVKPDGTFHVRSQRAHAPHRDWTASAVVLATGAYDVANELGIPGEHLPHVSHYYKEPYGFYRRRVVIVGGKNSSAEAALDLYRAGASVLIVHRRAALGDSIKYWVKPDIENRIKEGAIEARFLTRVIEIRPAEIVLAPAGTEIPPPPAAQTVEPADAVLLMTGYRSDTTLLRMAGAEIDEAEGAPVHDPETFETTVPNLFLAGAVVAGRQSGRIFIENGRFHGQRVIREIATRRGTGVFSTG